MAGRGRKRNNVLFSKPEEPDFLKRMKAEIGYTEGDNVETKVSLLFSLPEKS